MLICFNVGGSLEKSEILSFEFFWCCFGVDLQKIEMEVQYFFEGGFIIDYMCMMFSIKVGVFVIRVMKY